MQGKSFSEIPKRHLARVLRRPSGLGRFLMIRLMRSAASWMIEVIVSMFYTKTRSAFVDRILQIVERFNDRSCE